MILGIVCIWLYSLIPTACYAATPETKEEIPSGEVRVDTLKSLADLMAYRTRISKDLLELNVRIHKLDNPALFQEVAQDKKQRLKLLAGKIRTVESAPDVRYNEQGNIKYKSHELYYSIRKIRIEILSSIELLSKLKEEWVEKKEIVESSIDAIDQDPSLKVASKEFLELRKKIDQALEIISGRLKPFIEVGKQFSDLEIELHGINLRIDAMAKAVEEETISIFSGHFYSQINKALFSQSFKTMKAFFVTLGAELLVPKYKTAVVLGLVILLFAALIHYSGQWVKPSAEWQAITQLPFSTTIFLMDATLSLFDFFNEDFMHMPASWEYLKDMIVCLVMLRIIRRLLANSWQQSFFTLFAIVYIVFLSMSMVKLSPLLIYPFSFAASIVLITAAIYQVRSKGPNEKNRYEVIGLYLFSVLFGLTGIFFMMSYNDQALLYFSSLIHTCAYGLFFWILFKVTKAFVELMVTITPLPIVQRNAAAIVQNFSPLIFLFYSLVFLVVVLLIWHVFRSQEEAFEGIKSFQLTIDTWKISPALFVSAAGVIYITLIISKMIQGLLHQEILPRYQVTKGLQFSITRIINYFFLLCGVLFVLKVFGFGLTNLTILGGALGIGIGFGLQAIVNNLVCGLILLFERPVKVGDMVQVENDIGEIQEIGLRATVVRTFDDAKIVIPNADFITGKVVNWTLTDRRVRVKIPVGVAYGTNVPKVLELLVGCADENPRVLSDPKPMALFLAFGASSLDFELRAWICEFGDRQEVRSELNQAIDAEFALAGITIPFPQRDLHIKSDDRACPEGIPDTGEAVVDSA